MSFARTFVGFFFCLLLATRAGGQETATSFRYPLADYPFSDGCREWGAELRKVSCSDSVQVHLADDACTASGTDVFAVANGKVMYAAHGDPCPDWVWVMVTEHTLPSGSKVCAVYGHVQESGGINSGEIITKGQHIGDVVEYTCSSDHIHFGIYNGAYGAAPGVYASWLRGYVCRSGSPAGFVDPLAFVASHQEAFLATQTGYSVVPNGPYVPGQIIDCQVYWRNDGTATWSSSPGSQYVELGSCNEDGNLVASCLYATGLGWKSSIVPCTFNVSSVAPGATATFSFQGKVPGSAQPGQLSIYFGPVYEGHIMDYWEGNGFTITVVDPPPPPIASTPYDFDGDGFSDAWDRTSTGLFHIDFCDDGLWGWEWTGQNYGSTQDTPCPADYDGDGVWDIAILRSSDRKFLIDRAYNNLGWFDITHLIGYGGYGDIPVPADYDGDGSADIAIRWADTSFRVDYSSNGYGSFDYNEPGYGGVYDTPCAGDFNGDGSADIAILRNANRKFDIDYYPFDRVFEPLNLGGYGGYGDTPCPADYDHDGRDDIAVRDADGDFHIDYWAQGGGFGGWDWPGYGYGTTANPVRSGDYDGDGCTDIGVYMAASASLCFDRASNGFGTWDACDDGHPSWKIPPPDDTPSTDDSTLVLDSSSSSKALARWELFDVSGRLIATQTGADLPSSITRARRLLRDHSLPGGIYFVRQSHATGFATQKLLIIR